MILLVLGCISRDFPRDAFASDRGRTHLRLSAVAGTCKAKDVTLKDPSL